MAHDVFISYSTENATVADAVCAGLERRGIRCWIAPRDIEPGQDHASATVNAIDTCKVFVIIVSAASNDCESVLTDLRCAATKGKPIIPFRVEDVALSDDMRYYLGTRQWLDALTTPLDRHIARLSETVTRLLRIGTGPTLDLPRSRGRSRVAIAVVVLVVAAISILLVHSVMRWARQDATGGATPPSSADAAAGAGHHAGEDVKGPDGGTLVWVPAGSFTMGGVGQGFMAAQPAHRVELSGFWIGKCEVTNAQYRAFCEVTGREWPPNSDQGDKHPVVSVSWQEAHDYCEHYGLALPTEAQWEYAAAGPDARRYPWGDDWDPGKLCYDQNRGPEGETFPVGSFPAGASWCGALDMAGNVQEWCADWYDSDYYASSPVLNPPGPDHGTGRVCRNGGWDDNGEDKFRCAERQNYSDPSSSPRLGFRCVRVVR